MAKVWIKVCYMKSHWNGRRVYIITLNVIALYRVSDPFESDKRESR